MEEMHTQSCVDMVVAITTQNRERCRKEMTRGDKNYCLICSEDCPYKEVEK